MTRSQSARVLPLLGNEAVARGLVEAGCQVVLGYPGTPSSEVLPAVVRFANGASLLLEASFAANLKENVFNTHLYGTEAGASAFPLEIYGERHGAVTDTTVPTFGRWARVKPHSAEVAAFVEALRNGKPVPVPGEEALVATEIIDGIYASAARGRVVRMRTGRRA